MQNKHTSAEEIFKFKRMLKECADVLPPSDSENVERIKYLEKRVAALTKSMNAYRFKYRFSQKRIADLKKVFRYEFGIEVYNRNTDVVMKRIKGLASMKVARSEARRMRKDVVDQSIVYTPIYRTASKWKKLLPQARLRGLVDE